MSKSVLAEVLGEFDVPEGFWANLVGCSVRQLTEWRAGQRELPASVADKFARAIGVPADVLLNRARVEGGAVGLLPPMWLKARAQGLGEKEHETIAKARMLAAKYDETLALLEPPSEKHRIFLNEIKSRVDVQAPATHQGAVAAAAFLDLSGLAQTQKGIGEVFRGALRARGILILETPVSSPTFEGFCVPVGTVPTSRPCLLANSYRTTWFRRNYVLLHELAHAIFDLEGATAVFDTSTDTEGARGPVEAAARRIAEDRADSFAMRALVSEELLVAMENRGYKLEHLGRETFAHLIANVHAEQRTIVRAALAYNMVDDEQARDLDAIVIPNRELAAVSKHARGIAALSREELVYPEVQDWKDRMTTFPVMGIRLPIPFVRLVLQALGAEKITAGKAAELLMVTREDLATRYGVHAETLP